MRAAYRNSSDFPKQWSRLPVGRISGLNVMGDDVEEESAGDSRLSAVFYLLSPGEDWNSSQGIFISAECKFSAPCFTSTGFREAREWPVYPGWSSSLWCICSSQGRFFSVKVFFHRGWISTSSRPETHLSLLPISVHLDSRIYSQSNKMDSVVWRTLRLNSISNISMYLDCNMRVGYAIFNTSQRLQ